jgi:MarR family transcriptional regulator, lower aerobic nicotinate degradation pathway regulator
MSASEPAAAGRAEPEGPNTLFYRPGFLIRRLHQIHLALFAEECAAFDITPVQYSILTVAKAQPKLDQMQVALEVGIDRATLANVLARLELKKIVRRTPCASDKRLKLVSLTARGATLLEKMREPVQRAHERTIAALPEAEREVLMTLLTQLVDAQNAHGRTKLRLG